jgi:hypothetical protein
LIEDASAHALILAFLNGLFRLLVGRLASCLIGIGRGFVGLACLSGEGGGLIASQFSPIYLEVPQSSPSVYDS